MQEILRIDIFLAFTEHKLFSFPPRLPSNMASNLSVPLAFVALLHLANEKVGTLLYGIKTNKKLI